MGSPAKRGCSRKKKRLKKYGRKRKEDRIGQVFKETERKKQEIPKYFKTKEEKKR